ncbi:serine hydrolase [Clostridium saudiense]|nr:serine hydrolase [Clostridium saudiense]
MNKKYRIKTIPLLILLAILLLSSFYIYKIFILKENISNESILTDDNITPKIVTNTQSSYDSSPTLSLTISDYSSLSYTERLDMLYDNNYSIEDRIKMYLADDLDNVGLIYHNFENNNTININEDKEFIAASTYKVGLNFYAYYLYSIGELDLDQYIEYLPEDYEEGTGILQDQDYIGSYKIQDLLDLSLIYSDNIATNMLGRYLGGHEEVRKNLYDLLKIDFQSEENIITPEIEYKILKYIYEFSYYPNFSHMLSVLTHSEYNDRIAKYIDSDIVAHKIGTYDTYIHDVGIVFSNSPYIIILYTHDLEDAEEKIANISKAIFQYNNLDY